LRARGHACRDDERIATAEGVQRQMLHDESGAPRRRSAPRSWARRRRVGRIHSVERAVEVGSVDRIISAAELRPHLIETVERAAATGHPVAAG
jgi:hypothetical protein